MADILRTAKRELQPLGVPLIASVFGDSQTSFVQTVRVLAEAEPDYIELNISCPNVEAEFGRPFAADPLSAARVTEAASLFGTAPGQALAQHCRYRRRG